MNHANVEDKALRHVVTRNVNIFLNKMANVDDKVLQYIGTFDISIWKEGGETCFWDTL